MNLEKQKRRRLRKCRRCQHVVEVASDTGLCDDCMEELIDEAHAIGGQLAELNVKPPALELPSREAERRRELVQRWLVLWAKPANLKCIQSSDAAAMDRAAPDVCRACFSEPTHFGLQLCGDCRRLWSGGEDLNGSTPKVTPAMIRLLPLFERLGPDATPHELDCAGKADGMPSWSRYTAMMAKRWLWSRK